MTSSNQSERDAIIGVVAREIFLRLMHIEPGSVTLDFEGGEGSISTTTDEGKFLASMLEMLNSLRSKNQH